jgi:hypothetical protein
MNRTELQNKYPSLQQPQTIELLNDLAAHLRRVSPFLSQQSMDAPMGEHALARHAGRMEGWAFAAEIIQSIHVLPKAPAAPVPVQNYVPPTVKSEAQS